MELPYIKVNQGCVELNGKRVDTILEMNVHYKPEKQGIAEVTMKIDAKVDLEGIAEIKKENSIGKNEK